MKREISLLFVLLLALVVAVSAVGLAQAQDATAATGPVQCDYDLVLDLYVAERFFDFDQIRNQVMGTGATPIPMVDLNVISKGQFTPWFSGDMVSGSVLTADQASQISNLLTMDDATLQSTLGSAAGTTTEGQPQLTPLTPASEPAECAQLRTELTRFYSVLAYQGFTGAVGSGDMGAVTLPGEATVAPEGQATVAPEGQATTAPEMQPTATSSG
jgi:hypothetical protein